MSRAARCLELLFRACRWPATMPPAPRAQAVRNDRVRVSLTANTVARELKAPEPEDWRLLFLAHLAGLLTSAERLWMYLNTPGGAGMNQFGFRHPSILGSVSIASMDGDVSRHDHETSRRIVNLRNNGFNRS